MLKNLSIQNFALIDQLEIALDAELNIITGETGAGKSIILGAIGLLMGNRADVKALFKADEKCIVEGEFDLGKLSIKPLFESFDLDFDQHTIIRREISPSGKSRAFVNDTPVVLGTLKAISENLIDVHSQHDTLLLGSKEYQLDIVDAFAGNAELLEQYKNDFNTFKQYSKELASLEAKAQGSQDEFDYNNFLWEEIDEAHVQLGEKEKTEEELKELENAEEVGNRLKAASTYFTHPEQSISSMTREALAQINPLSSFGTIYKDLVKRLQSSLIELEDIAEEIQQKSESVELNEERVGELKDRLDQLFKLFQKHKVQDEEQLLAKKELLSQQLKDVLDYDDRLKKLQTQVSESESKCRQLAKKLNKNRVAVAPKITKDVVALLVELGIPNASFEVNITKQELDNTGSDDLVFLFSANKGVSAQPLKKVASGGEFSRLMLVLKYFLAQKKSLPSIIFDEIDTGISGEVAIKMGALLKKMSKYMQVSAITHLHQIAGKGTSHFYVYKKDEATRTVSRIKKLNKDERVIEIAKMIGGENPSDAAIENALEVLAS